MFPDTTKPISLAIFCKVVDNFGDIGICWRLARQLRHEHGVAVTLWVDDLRSFARICPELADQVDVQSIANVTVRHWSDQEGKFTPADIADIVIEFFACDIPPGYIAAMAQCQPRPVWLNLEGLSAEEWVEGCHTLPSMHPRLPLTKHFFFPGFTSKTGGLLREAALDEQRRQFQADPGAMAAFLAQFGVTTEEMASTKLSLFCYPHAPVSELCNILHNSSTPYTLLVPEGVATDAIEQFLGAEAKIGASRTHGSLTVRVLPFVAQPDYDKLLWACDFNFVRGEDSFVRAQFADRPFIWHIYPQDENLHLVKLRAFLGRYSPDIESLNQFALGWNGACDWTDAWPAVAQDLPRISARSAEWYRQMLAHGDLAHNLLRFADSLRSARPETGV